MNNLMKTKESIDNIFSDFFHPSKKSFMKTDVVETENELKFYVDLPGIKKEDIKINIEDGYLQIDGKKKCEYQTSGEYIYKERCTENYSRSYYIGKDINEDEVTANLNDGVLFLSIPKKEEVKTKKYIEIK